MDNPEEPTELTAEMEAELLGEMNLDIADEKQMEVELDKLSQRLNEAVDNIVESVDEAFSLDVELNLKPISRLIRQRLRKSISRYDHLKQEYKQRCRAETKLDELKKKVCEMKSKAAEEKTLMENDRLVYGPILKLYVNTYGVKLDIVKAVDDVYDYNLYQRPDKKIQLKIDLDKKKLIGFKAEFNCTSEQLVKLKTAYRGHEKLPAFIFTLKDVL